MCSMQPQSHSSLMYDFTNTESVCSLANSRFGSFYEMLQWFDLSIDRFAAEQECQFYIFGWEQICLGSMYLPAPLFWWACCNLDQWLHVSSIIVTVRLAQHSPRQPGLLITFISILPIILLISSFLLLPAFCNFNQP